jgi:hypothetical protein
VEPSSRVVARVVTPRGELVLRRARAGTQLVVSALRPGGLVSVWSAMASAKYEERLRRHLDDVAVLEVPVPRGGPDVVYVGRRHLIADPRTFLPI